MPAIYDWPFASLPVGNDVRDGQCDIEFDHLSLGWMITSISVLDEDSKLVELIPGLNAFRHVRNCLYAYRGDHIADAVRDSVNRS
jgi:hypothetical protein